MMLKKNVRLNYIGLRENISTESLLNSSLSIANKLLELPIWSFDYYHLFLPILEKKEVDTTFLLSILQGKDKYAVLPKMCEEGVLSHYLLTDSTSLRKNRWNVAEPVDGIVVLAHKIDVVFIPLLAFDQQGNRVGYGKGFYDRFLAECRSDVIKVGLSVFEAEIEITDIDDHDVRLDYCVTPKKTYSFSTD